MPSEILALHFVALRMTTDGEKTKKRSERGVFSSKSIDFFSKIAYNKFGTLNMREIFSHNFTPVWI